MTTEKSAPDRRQRVAPTTRDNPTTRDTYNPTEIEPR